MRETGNSDGKEENGKWKRKAGWEREEEQWEMERKGVLEQKGRGTKQGKAPYTCLVLIRS